MPDSGIVWLAQAQAEKDEIVDYIAAHNVTAAFAVDERIAMQTAQLAAFPRLGRRGRVPGTFELVISGTPYVVAYRLFRKQVQILHVFHARRRWPPA